jgi:hypothetical protein
LVGISDILVRISLQLFGLDRIGKISTKLEHANTIQRVSPSSQESVSDGQAAADECPYGEENAWEYRRDNAWYEDIRKAVARNVPVTKASTIVLRSSKLKALRAIVHQLYRRGAVCS